MSSSFEAGIIFSGWFRRPQLFSPFTPEVQIATQANVTQLGNLNSRANFQHLGDFVSQSNLTRLGNLSIQINVLIRLGDSASQQASQNNGTSFNAASQTNDIPVKLGSSGQSPKLASVGSTEIDFNCQTATFKSRANNEGVILKDFVYTYKCVPGWDQFWNLEEVKGAIEGISLALEKEACQIQPQLSEVLKAFMVKPDKIKAVILCQDPTPPAGKATGLAFSLFSRSRSSRGTQCS